MLITAGGKNVAPAEMEAHLKSIPGVGQAVVVGDRQPYLCALLVLDDEALPDLCKAAGVADGGTIADYAGNSTVIDFLEKRIETDCNAKVARYQTIKKFRVVPNAFTVETDELTPTMKVRRNVVNDKYVHLIDSMYDKNKPVATATP
jgi:long-chain acyl-CoA synthetase